MSIEKTWGEMNSSQDDDLSSLLQKSTLSKLSSHNPLEKIRKNLLINMIWAVLICFVYIWIIFYFNIWQVQVAISVVLLFHYGPFTQRMFSIKKSVHRFPPPFLAGRNENAVRFYRQLDENTAAGSAFGLPGEWSRRFYAGRCFGIG